jgi:hypothetical protein
VNAGARVNTTHFLPFRHPGAPPAGAGG